MGIFNKTETTNSNAVELLEKQDKGQISNREFLCDFGKEHVFYSTPYGDHIDGKPRLFLVPGPDGTGYLPVFTSMERTKEFFEQAGRAGYIAMHAPFANVAQIALKVNNDGAPVKMGLIRDPGYYGVTVDAKYLEIVLSMMNG